MAQLLCALVRLRLDSATSWLQRLTLLVETRSALFSKADHDVIQRAWRALGKPPEGRSGRRAGAPPGAKPGKPAEHGTAPNSSVGGGAGAPSRAKRAKVAKLSKLLNTGSSGNEAGSSPIAKPAKASKLGTPPDTGTGSSGGSGKGASAGAKQRKRQKGDTPLDTTAVAS